MALRSLSPVQDLTSVRVRTSVLASYRRVLYICHEDLPLSHIRRSESNKAWSGRALALSVVGRVDDGVQGVCVFRRAEPMVNTCFRITEGTRDRAGVGFFGDLPSVSAIWHQFLTPLFSDCKPRQHQIAGAAHRLNQDFCTRLLVPIQCIRLSEP